MGKRTVVLIVDDDPVHLDIYGMIVESAGFEPVRALVRHRGVELPETAVDLVVMDYRLAGTITAVDIAQRLRQQYPGAPIVLLSDIYDLPSDIAPYVDDFVRKGEPEKLIATLVKHRDPGSSVREDTLP